MDSANFKESEHPRDDDGKFSSQDGSSTSGKGEKKNGKESKNMTEKNDIKKQVIKYLPELSANPKVLEAIEKRQGKLLSNKIAYTKGARNHIVDEHGETEANLFEQYGHFAIKDPKYIFKNKENGNLVFMGELPTKGYYKYRNVIVELHLAEKANRYLEENTVVSAYRVKENKFDTYANDPKLYENIFTKS